MRAGSGLGSDSGPTSARKPAVDYYRRLGVTPFINAAGTYTVLSAATMPSEVRAAVAEASRHCVHLDELLHASGEYIARRLRCEAALVTAGAASSLILGTAACITRGNDAAILRIPTNMNGLKNEVPVQWAHRHDHDRPVRNAGARLVEVETLGEYERAFNERTAMTYFFNAAEGGKIGRDDWVRVAHERGVPCLNNAAADVPPVSNLWNYTQMGFDLVTFSGGKGLRGPQCTGLLRGRKDLIAAARKNNSPNPDTIGRGMKVAKEEIVGLVAAVDWLLDQDEPAMMTEYARRANRIAAELRSLPTVQTRVFVPPIANRVPHLLITYDPSKVRIGGAEITRRMRQGTPRIELNPGTGETPASAGLPGGPNTIVVGVWTLEPGEELIVARRLREVLQAAVRT